MRVNISYSIDFEDVPKTVGKIIEDAQEENLSEINSGCAELLQLISEENEKSSIDKIVSIRTQMRKLDSILLDCANILAGYQKALIDPELGTKDAEG
jgi:uncharacterized protein YjgD (DUF1641 family)